MNTDLHVTVKVNPPRQKIGTLPTGQTFILSSEFDSNTAPHVYIKEHNYIRSVQGGVAGNIAFDYYCYPVRVTKVEVELL